MYWFHRWKPRDYTVRTKLVTIIVREGQEEFYSLTRRNYWIVTALYKREGQSLFSQLYDSPPRPSSRAKVITNLRLNRSPKLMTKPAHLSIIISRANGRWGTQAQSSIHLNFKEWNVNHELSRSKKSHCLLRGEYRFCECDSQLGRRQRSNWSSFDEQRACEWLRSDVLGVLPFAC